MLIDISRPIHPAMALYPNNPGVSIRTVQKANGDASGLTEISLGSHTGTHIDALSHIEATGWGVEAYSLEQLVGPCEVVEIPNDVSVIHEIDIPPTTSSRVLLKTRNSSQNVDTFDPDFTALSEDAAQCLIRRGVALIGIDGPSIKKKGAKDRVHQMLLEKKICIIEGLYVRDVEPGNYELICLPMAVSGIDGSPVRAILRV